MLNKRAAVGTSTPIGASTWIVCVCCKGVNSERDKEGVSRDVWVAVIVAGFLSEVVC